MRTPTIILAGLATLGLSLAAGPAAQASVTYGQVSSFAPGPVDSPFGVGVDPASSDVYVASITSEGPPLAKFSATGGMLLKGSL